MRLLTKLKNNKKWKSLRASTWSRINQVLIHEQLGISKEGIVNTVNATFEKAETTLKRIIGPCFC
jgi:hypothetical protein